MLLKSIRFLILLLLVTLVFGEEYKELKIEQGTLSGVVETSFLRHEKYYAFRGIPYAEPPIGDLRFLAPIPHKGWVETYEAHTTKNTCMQFNVRMRNGESYGISGSEDCLYLSVYTPKLNTNLPIIVFDYNDHFRTAFNGTETYAPDFFMEEDVIIVTISHRTGVFGYLTTEDDVITGNAGLKDFVLGLKWIKDNIKCFGGDPDRVTLMGNRGGAAIADMLLYSDKVKDYFHRAILQSGTALETIYFPQNPREKAFALGRALNISADNSNLLLTELRKVNAIDILMHESSVVDAEQIRNTQMSVLPFSPTVEHDHKEAILMAIHDNIKIKNDVPIIIGFNSREGLDLASHYIMEPRLIDEKSNEFLMHFPVRTNFSFNKDSTVYTNVEQAIKDFYFEIGELTIYNVLEYAVYVGDMLQIYASDFAARKLAKEMKSSVFSYVFDFRGSFNENSEYISRNSRSTVEYWGATITDELCYLFICSRLRKKYNEINELPSEQREFKILKKMVRMWTNFAKTGNPTPADDKVLKGLVWIPTTNTERRFLHISKQMHMKTDPFVRRFKFWDELLSKYSKLAVDGIVTDHDEL